ncbi:TetR/AcrR family transcriptional regulator [Kribbella monticola]|uniref:TetR/AcrR family transcriptional regulator n=1 Tax=Kribbella monticola TaxID=2185285 RepID=UPI000DD41554|nr:TetR/AcrR family transcriptional regulator [Kribbella monticola]
MNPRSSAAATSTAPSEDAAGAGGRRDVKPLPCTRPSRADAARNYDLLVMAARQAFEEHGTDTSLEEIARRAGVGIGTLYRRFPSRTALLEAVYVEEIQSVCDRAHGFADKLGPFDALAAWLQSFVDYSVSKKSLASELTVALGKDSEFFTACKMNVREAGDLLLDRAKEAGTVRPELELMDILRLVGGITMGREMEPDQANRLLDIVLAGLKAAPAS